MDKTTTPIKLFTTPQFIYDTPSLGRYFVEEISKRALKSGELDLVMREAMHEAEAGEVVKVSCIYTVSTVSRESATLEAMGG